MAVHAHSQPIVCVVDARPADYAKWAEAAQQAGMVLRQFRTGREALRASRDVATDLWIINVDLPDMSGFELVEKLQPRASHTAAFLVADTYRVDDEVRALSLGVTMYRCKPASTEWLGAWRPCARQSLSAQELSVATGDELTSCAVPPPGRGPGDGPENRDVVSVLGATSHRSESGACPEQAGALGVAITAGGTVESPTRTPPPLNSHHQFASRRA
jgi:CheY-like chemotaxis protein